MKARWMLYALLFSVAVNIAAVAVIAYYWSKGPVSARAKPPRRPAEPWAELNLTEKQKARFDSIRDDYFRSMHPMWEELRKERTALASAVLNGPADSAQVAQHIRRISELQAQMELRTLRFFTQLRDELSPEQAARFRKMIEDMVKQRGPRPHRRREFRGEDGPGNPDLNKPNQLQREGGGLNEKSRSDSDDACFAADCGLCARSAWPML
jgi:Spy/CpxP family protein refolding chaperone